MTEDKRQRREELYEQAQDWLHFARRRHEKGDMSGESVALYQLKVVIKRLRKAVESDGEN